ncbi:MAG: hypothetical protein M3Z11_08930 [Candidatus Dormibacteraeota bacterium]|nr:hypothetical protein [Candidatus Dormibacteraeota bacterium]
MKTLAPRLVAAILLTLVIVFGAVRVLDAARPPISEGQARAAALAQLSSTSGVSGFHVVSARRVLSGDRVTDDSGNVISTQSRSACPTFGFPAPGWLCPAGPVWVLHFRAPPQNGFLLWEAYVVVDAQTGKVSSASTDGTNQ